MIMIGLFSSLYETGSFLAFFFAVSVIEIY